MDDAYAYAEPDSQEHADQAKQIARCVSKLKGSSRHSQLRVLAGLLEQLPQDLGALGSAKAREVLLESLGDRAILHSKQKDVRMYASACFAQLLRIYAPETPYDDKQLEVRLAAGLEPTNPYHLNNSTPAAVHSLQQHWQLHQLTARVAFHLQPVFELLLWSIEQVQEYQAPTYEFAVSVLQTISQVSPVPTPKQTSNSAACNRSSCSHGVNIQHLLVAAVALLPLQPNIEAAAFMVFDSAAACQVCDCLDEHPCVLKTF